MVGLKRLVERPGERGDVSGEIFDGLVHDHDGTGFFFGLYLNFYFIDQRVWAAVACKKHLFIL